MNKKKQQQIQQNQNKIINKEFRLRNKRIFLTYPHAEGLSKELLHDSIRKLCNNAVVIITAHEFSDAEIEYEHYHIFVEFSTRCDIKNADYLDIKIGDKSIHGDYKPAKTRLNSIQYVMKDGDYLVYGELSIAKDLIKKNTNILDKIMIKSLSHGISIEDKLSDTIERFRNKDQTLLFNKDDIDILKSYRKNTREWDKLIQMSYKYPEPETDYIYVHSAIYRLIEEWLRLDMNKMGEMKTTLFIKGASLMRKTTLIRFICHPNYILLDHKDATKYHSTIRHQALIYDDCPYGHLNRPNTLKMIDGERDYMKDNKGGMAMYRSNKICKIMLSNFSPYEDLEFHDPAVMRRLRYIDADKIIDKEPIMYDDINEIPQNNILKYQILSKGILIELKKALFLEKTKKRNIVSQ